MSKKGKEEKPVRVRCAHRDFFALDSSSEKMCIRLAISVGSGAQTGGRLQAAVDYVNSLGLDSESVELRVELGDTLQRHNIAVIKDCDQEAALEASKEAGREWITANQPILNQLQCGYEIVSWETWRQDESYAPARAKLDALVASDPNFAKAIEGSAQEFLERYLDHHPEKKEDATFTAKYKAASTEYLKEECAIIMSLWSKHKEKGCVFYPAKMTAALSVAYERFVHNKDHFKWIDYTFKTAHRKSPIKDFSESFAVYVVSLGPDAREPLAQIILNMLQTMPPQKRNKMMEKMGKKYSTIFEETKAGSPISHKPSSSPEAGAL